MVQLPDDGRVRQVAGHMCTHNLRMEGAAGMHHVVVKRTIWVTPAGLLAQQVGNTCCNLGLKQDAPARHAHTTLRGTCKTQAAALYSHDLSMAILRGIKKQRVR